MADKVQKVLEDMVPELLDLGKREVFSGTEIRNIIERRRDFEYKLASRTPLLGDFLEYLEYEYELERIRFARTRKLGLKKRTIGDYSIIRIIHFIFKRALRRYPNDEKLWLQYIDFCLKSGSSRILQRNMITALRNLPTSATIWIIMADREFQSGNAKSARSILMLGLRINKYSFLMWRGLAQLEANIIYKLYLNEYTKSELALSAKYSKKATAASLEPILKYALTRIEPEGHKHAFLVYMYRILYNLYLVRKSGTNSDTCNKKTPEIHYLSNFETTLTTNIYNNISSQPIFVVFFGIIKMINLNKESDKDFIQDPNEIITYIECMMNESLNLLLKKETEGAGIFSMLLICRFLYQCGLNNMEELDGWNSDEKNNFGKLRNVVDFGFSFSDQSDSLEYSANMDSKNNSSTIFKGNLLKWLSFSSSKGIIDSYNIWPKSMLDLLTVEPFIWNCCILSNPGTDKNEFDRLKNSSKILEINNIKKESLFPQELLLNFKSFIQNNVLSDENNVNRIYSKLSDIYKHVMSTKVQQNLSIPRVMLIEALLYCKSASPSNILVSTNEFDRYESLCEPSEYILKWKCLVYKLMKDLDSVHITEFINLIKEIHTTIANHDIQAKDSRVIDLNSFLELIFLLFSGISNKLNRKSDIQLIEELSKLKYDFVCNALIKFPVIINPPYIPYFIFNVLIFWSIDDIQYSPNFISEFVDTNQFVKSEINFITKDIPILSFIIEHKEPGRISRLSHYKQRKIIYTEKVTRLANIIKLPTRIRQVILLSSYLSILSCAMIEFSCNLRSILKHGPRALNDADIYETTLNIFSYWKSIIEELQNIKADITDILQYSYLKYILFTRVVEDIVNRRLINVSNIFPVSSTALLLQMKNSQIPLFKGGNYDSDIQILSRMPLDDIRIKMILDGNSHTKMDPYLSNVITILDPIPYISKWTCFACLLLS
ncbi:uncharacterized protein CMU_024810 [Cryptosporidium muris RN66]|uniref:U3 small nucleolar RNA-associated protein 6 N-terminal domain-containing protein n=1 Tax=Cryptosporidium muris (strain RN66) TaxID=441375 RepID=B6AAS3_CRYMR|nr:uncharacterized protein CMU_024810 [Cryptosporidium muris RN66]EEA05475.1 hypothetical protein, conserved [Cryptosporidium muris RN66]|eukprot:XP_002139824.1 hypothetical protein [Cryptosporidium muris RN66]